MNSPRDAQFDALLAQVTTATLNGAPAFFETSRKYRHWDDVPDAELPAAYLTKGFEFASQNARGETKWRLKALLWVYCFHSPDSGTTPGTALNNLLDAVEQALKPPVWDSRQTLNGLVEHCFIDGEVIVSEGSLPNDRRSIAVVPIVMETGV